MIGSISRFRLVNYRQACDAGRDVYQARLAAPRGIRNNARPVSGGAI
jgi:hypothetical protein